MSEENIHAGHRERVRRRFESEGDLKSFNDLDKLELLLFYCIRRGDTKVLAHRLIDAFGTYAAVLDAPREALMSVDGIGDSAATFLKLIPAAARAYLDTPDGGAVLETAEDAKAFFAKKLSPLRSERMLMAALGADGSVIKTAVLSEGSVDSGSLDLRRVVAELINCSAAAAVIAHNHPGSVAAPSKEDVELTRRVASALSVIGATLADHIIIAGADAFSFAQNEKTRESLTVG